MSPWRCPCCGEEDYRNLEEAPICPECMAWMRWVKETQALLMPARIPKRLRIYDRMMREVPR